ncbi:MAG: hypothetical protein HND47_03015 [Chloroflexi bacterium]|nr:hypothetical protein [Chloroflexota bacterium]
MPFWSRAPNLRRQFWTKCRSGSEGWEQSLSRFRLDSELSRLNRTFDQPTAVSAAFWDVFQKLLCRRTNSARAWSRRRCWMPCSKRATTAPSTSCPAINSAA